MAGEAGKRAWTYIDGKWLEGNPPVMGPLTQAAWLSAVIFDGARAFQRKVPDLALHCERAIRSAITMGLKPKVGAKEIEKLAREAVAKFPPDAELYIRPMFWAEHGGVEPDPDSTRFLITVYDSPMPKDVPFSTCFSRFRRPTPETAPTEAKASCLYPNSARALLDARDRGFENAIMLDMNGNVAEFAGANIFIVKNGKTATPVANGCFLAGITRQRIIKLLREAGHAVEERRVTPDDVLGADEVFSAGNYAKVLPCNKVESRDLQPGPVYRRARELYFKFAEGQTL
ncbi:MAG TPA: branched-chain amino acid aminotransferase [Alphaproteobacteria bacterium]|nr:branched-chain amino acid aminotransferase [Alphaproteobacteria bacterium]